MSTRKSIPGAPAHLDNAGAKLWEKTVELYDLSEHELAILGQACRTLDMCESLSRVVRRDGYMVKGSMGQKVVNPAIPELRQQRSALASLFRALDLPDVEASSGEDVEVPAGVATLQQRTAGLTRWSKAHG